MNSGTINRQQVLFFAIIHILAIGAVFYLPDVASMIGLVILHFVTGCLGISLGYHRLLSHRAFRTNETFKRVLATCGTLAFMGGPITWAALHRGHHAKTDAHGDPHSRANGFLWSHVLWSFNTRPNGFSPIAGARYTRDLLHDPYLVWLDKNHLSINLVFAALCGLLFGPAFFFWAFPVRILIVWHTVWLVNSFGHTPSSEDDAAIKTRNSIWLGLISYGEGFHFNHHEKPSSPKLSEQRNEIDLGYVCLRGLRAVGLVSTSKSTRKAE